MTKSCCTPSRPVDAGDAQTPVPGPGNHASATAEATAPAGRGDPGRTDRVEVPGGNALVGTRNQFLPVDGEGPMRSVKVKPFGIDSTAVTNERFAAFVDDTGFRTEAEVIGWSYVFYKHLPKDSGPWPEVPEARWWRGVDGANWRLIHGPGSEEAWQPDHPVVHVSWNDANAFARWASGRLPTEAEWEHAARGGLGDVKFPWGDDEPDDTDFQPCNIWQGEFPRTNTARDGHEATAPARSFEPNGYGLYNMVGNVWEWTGEPFRVRSLRKDARANADARRGYKLLKGGSFLCHRSYCYRYRIAARTGNSPDGGTSHTGFRLVYEATA